MKKLVYSFGRGKTDGHAGMRDLLGGKGANLAEMTRLGIPVPPGFTISTHACNLYFKAGGKLPRELPTQVGRALKTLERLREKGFGDAANPLLVSVRSGAAFSMPGMMDTILNLGLNDRTVQGLAEAGGERFAFDSYRRFVQMYGSVVLSIDKNAFEDLLHRAKQKKGVTLDTGLDAKDLKKLVERFKAVVRKNTGKPFPQDPEKQLWGAITAVFKSWNTDRARLYRQQYDIPDDLGTGVNVQCMVFGNLGDDCATGVAFSRDPATGEDFLYGEYLINAQGEDVVAGIRTPNPISRHQADDAGDATLEALMPAAYRELQKIRRKLERHYKDMQDVEFTIERGKLYMLQTRTGKRTGQAAMRIAFDLHRARTIKSEEVVQRVDPEMLVQLLAPEFDPAGLKKARSENRVLARGLPAGPGAASGVISFSADRAREVASTGQPVVLVRTETSPEDIGGMVASVGIVTSRGGITSHAAVVARGMGKPCVVGAESLVVDEQAGRFRVNGRSVKEGDSLSIDGTTGEVILGAMEPRPSEIQRALTQSAAKERSSESFRRFNRLLGWADRARRLGVRANADTPEDARIARAMGAEGIGLCRTEHMFFGEDRIAAVRRMILADDPVERTRAISELLPMQKKDFVGIFRAMDGLPVTIRLLDPPLHEFLPHESSQFRELAKRIGLSARELEQRARRLAETNPMLGHRGCRLGITFPEIYDMQVRAILEAASIVRGRGGRPRPEIMIPLIGTAREFSILEQRARKVAAEVQRRAKRRIPFQVGTMMEVPRACLVAGSVAAEAEFFSFGTNDLTQMTFGFSRDDVGKFLPDYIDRRILDRDPFQSIDVEGVGALVREAIRAGRESRPGLKLGVCGEHGGDPASIAFFHEVGADYVSCSPFRVPVARLASAQAALESGGSGTH